MDIIKLPYTSYLEVNVKDLSEFIQNELLEEKFPKDCWIDDIGDNIYYYLEEYFRKKDIEYDKDINDQLLDLLCNSIYEYLNLLQRMAFINLNSYEEVTAEDFIDYIKSHYPQCNSCSNEDLINYIDDNIHSLIEAYLSSLGLQFVDIDWDGGLDALYDECVDYLND